MKIPEFFNSQKSAIYCKLGCVFCQICVFALSFLDSRFRGNDETVSEIKKLQPPLTASGVRSLRAGDEVLISGVIYTARDMAHKRLCESLEAGQPLPFALEGAVIYFCGPTPARPGNVIGAAGPTTSSRMDAFSPKLIANGLKAMIGKGYRGDEVREALKKYGAVHLSTVGGAGALLSKHITSVEVIAYEDLGPEAISKLQVVDFPAVVAYDCYGKSVYEKSHREHRDAQR